MNIKAEPEKVFPQNASNRNKAKFCVRILRLLQETLKNESKIPEIGIGWCEDGNHFICNSQILGGHLKLKPNSINTNFRAHSFQIENINFEDLQKMFGNLPDLKNWKMRRIVNYTFNYQTTESDAEKIPCQEKPNRTLEIVSAAPNSMLPQITRDMLKHDKFILNQIEMLMEQVDYSLDWKNAFLNLISKDWCDMVNSIYNNNERISHINRPYNIDNSHAYDSIHKSNFISQIIERSIPQIDQNSLPYVEFNLGYLLKNSKCNSQTPDKVLFIEYLKLCLRYGILSRIASTILELSSQNGFYFTSWFIPSTDQQYAIEMMSRNELNWIIKLSKSNPNAFSFLSSHPEEFHSSHITFNPMPMKPENTLSMRNDETKSVLSRATFKEFITEVLGFAIPIDKPLDRQYRTDKDVKHVSLNEIVKTGKDMNCKISENDLLISDFELTQQHSLNDSQGSGQSGDYFHINWEPELKLSSQNSQNSHDLNFSLNMHSGIVPDLTCSQTSQGFL